MPCLLPVHGGGVVVLAVLLLSFVFFKKKGTKKRYLKPFVALLPVAAIALAIFPEFFSYAGNLISSVFYALGISTSEVSDFGNNVSGLASRTMQFSGLTWAKEHNALLLGFGPEAHVNKLIAYRNYLTGRWNTLSTIDCGYIGYILLYGIVGTVGYVIMYISAVKKSIVRSDENERSNIFNAYKYFYIAYFVGLLSSVGLDSLFFVFYFMMLIYIVLDKKECKNQAGSLYT